MPFTLASLIMVAMLALQVEMRFVTLSQRDGSLSYENQLSRRHSMSKRFYDHPESSEAFPNEFTPLIQVGRTYAPDDTPSEFSTQTQSNSSPAADLSLGSSQYESSGLTGYPTETSGTRPAGRPTYNTNQQSKNILVNSGSLNPNFIANGTSETEINPTKKPARKNFFLKSDIDGLIQGQAIPTQRQHSNAPMNLLKDEQSPDYGFVNHKNNDGQLRKVSYGVDANGNIVANSANVVSN